jgi:hypothetical protein
MAGHQMKTASQEFSDACILRVTVSTTGDCGVTPDTAAAR